MVPEPQFFFDVKSEENTKLIKECIARNGYTPEHNYDYFLSCEEKDRRLVFIYFGNYQGLLCTEWDNHLWQVESQIMAPKELRASLFLAFIKKTFESYPCKKIFVECIPEVRSAIIKGLKIFIPADGAYAGTKIIAGDIIDRLYTPIISLIAWDPALPGPEMSKLRKCKNRFQRNYTVTLLAGNDAAAVPLEEYRTLVHAWKKQRKARDRAYYEDYIQFFKNGFKGSDVHLALRLNGRLCGVSAAWKVPNTEQTVYYGINLHDYSIPELGDFLTVMFLEELKKAGYHYMDFGTSDEGLLRYKQKFNPISTYETVWFYIRPEKLKESKERDTAPVIPHQPAHPPMPDDHS